MSDDLVKRLRKVAEFGGTHLDGLWTEAADRIEELEGRLDDLMAELQEARMQSLADAGQAQEAYEKHLELEAENARLREALKPFADVTLGVSDEFKGHVWYQHDSDILTVSDFLEARAALKNSNSGRQTNER